MSTENYPLQLARALISLRHFSVYDVVSRTGILHSNLESYLTGADSALSAKSFARLFKFLGVEPTGLSPDVVHFFHVRIGRVKNHKNLLPLTTILPLLENHSALALPPRGSLMPVLIKAENCKVVLIVRKPRFVSLTVSDLGLTPGTFQGHDKTRDVPEYYRDLIFSESLKPNYFDQVLGGNFIDEDIDLLRIVALEHDVTISELVRYVCSKEEDAEGMLAEHDHVELSDDEVSAIDDKELGHGARRSVLVQFPEHFRHRKLARAA